MPFAAKGAEPLARRPRFWCVTSTLTHWLKRSRSPAVLTTASIAESSVVPIPIEILITPMMIAEPDRRWRIAGWTLLGSLIGTMAMYALGALFYQTAASWLIAELSWQDPYATFQQAFRDHGILAVAFVSLTALPLAVAALGAGAAGMNALLFLAIVGVTRAARYFGLALLTKFFGARVKHALDRMSRDRRLKILMTVTTLVVGAGVVWLMAS